MTNEEKVITISRLSESEPGWYDVLLKLGDSWIWREIGYQKITDSHYALLYASNSQGLKKWGRATNLEEVIERNYQKAKELAERIRSEIPGEIRDFTKE